MSNQLMSPSFCRNIGNNCHFQNDCKEHLGEETGRNNIVENKGELGAHRFYTDNSLDLYRNFINYLIIYIFKYIYVYECLPACTYVPR